MTAGAADFDECLADLGHLYCCSGTLQAAASDQQSLFADAPPAFARHFFAGVLCQSTIVLAGAGVLWLQPESCEMIAQLVVATPWRNKPVVISSMSALHAFLRAEACFVSSSSVLEIGDLVKDSLSREGQTIAANQQTLYFVVSVAHILKRKLVLQSAFLFEQL